LKFRLSGFGKILPLKQFVRAAARNK